jgi:hypothetical protein
VQYFLKYLKSEQEILEYSNNIKVMFVIGSDSCGHGLGRFKKLFEMGLQLIVIGREENNPD